MTTPGSPRPDQPQGTRRPRRYWHARRAPRTPHPPARPRRVAATHRLARRDVAERRVHRDRRRCVAARPATRNPGLKVTT